MVNVHVKSADGTERLLEAEESATLRDTAVAAGLPGIAGVCGGNMMCGTCHVYLDEAWVGRAGERSEDEEAVLDSLSLRAEVKPTSRLSCQIRLTATLDGLVVHLPKSQPGI